MVLVAAVVLTCVGGTVGGAIMGGVTGYAVAQASVPAAPVETTSPQTTQLHVESSSAVIEAVRRTKPAVVTVVNTLARSAQYSMTGATRASGSGVIVDERGYIVTNNHVVEDAQSLEVIFHDGRRATAQLVGTDEFSDLAVIKVDEAVPAVALLGDSVALQPGEAVIAIGSPLGDLKGTVTVGVVSAVNRDLELAPGYVMEELIQTDAAINHGNSGGPLVNLQGQVVGINTLVVRGSGNALVGPGDIAEGLGFAIPSNTVRTVTQQLISTGKVSRPYLGIRYRMVPLSSDGADSGSWGAEIMTVEPDEAAEHAGLRQGDIIVALNGARFTEDAPLVNRLMKFQPGDSVQLNVLRDGREQTMRVTLRSRPEPQANARP
jgi:2-alkenal reductase